MSEGTLSATTDTSTEATAVVDSKEAAETPKEYEARTINGQCAAAEESRELDLYGPDSECITPPYVTWYGSVSPEVIGFPVVGTDNFFAVYPTAAKPKRWTIVHRPSGLKCGNNWANRDEAEMAACWLFCNYADRPALHSRNRDLLLEGAGPRVRSTWNANKLFKATRPKRQRLGTKIVRQTALQKYYLERMHDLEQLRRRWRDIFLTDKDLAEKKASSLEAEYAAKKENLEAWEQTLVARAETLSSRENENQQERERLANIQEELTRASTELVALRDLLLSAIATIGQGQLDHTPIARNLRRIRLSTEAPVGAADDAT